MYIAMMSAMILQYLVHPYPRNYVPINVQRKKSAYITSNARIFGPTNQQLFDNARTLVPQNRNISVCLNHFNI